MARFPPRAPTPNQYRGSARKSRNRPTNVIPHPAYRRARARTHRNIRIALFGLQLFLGATALHGGIFVVSGLPLDWFRGTLFSGPMIPAMALTAVGVASFVAAALLAWRPGLGAPLAFVTGLAMAIFELVQVVTISLGDWLRPLGINFGHRVLAEGDPFGAALWLQPFYFAVGLLVMALAWRLIPPRTLDRLRARLTADDERP